MNASNTRRTERDFEPTGWFSLLVVLLICSLLGLLSQALYPTPWVGLGLCVDRLTAALSLLVAIVGLATYRFSLRYLDGEHNQRRFLRFLALTVLSAWLFMLASNFLLLVLAWMGTSFLLHALLTHYSDRPEVHLPASTKFYISRLGDVLLIVALWTMWWTSGVWDLHAYLAWSQTHGTAPWIVLLLVLAALTKSAQVPFHIWLPETLESPTPVSALMHAGIINAGGALLLRFAPVLALEPTALLTLSLVGTLTAVVGALAMWSQIKAKRVLAWSTVSQMGFMMVQLGLAAFPAALLHLLGHGLYKAYAFLRVGSLPPETRLNAPSPWWVVLMLSVGTLVSLPLMLLATWATGFSPWEQPGELALALLVGLATAQLWVAILGPRFRLTGVLLTAGLQLGALLLAFGLYRGSMVFFAPVLGLRDGPVGTLANVAAWVPVVALGVLTFLHALFPSLAQTTTGRALQLHALHGFYLGPWVESMLRRTSAPAAQAGRQLPPSPQTTPHSPSQPEATPAQCVN
jgi:NAD(P)H-quinone oxidoreductase subunit 5